MSSGREFAERDRVALEATVQRLHQMPTGPVVTVELDGVDQRIMLDRAEQPASLKQGDKLDVYGIVTHVDRNPDGTLLTIMLDGWDDSVVVPLERVKPDL